MLLSVVLSGLRKTDRAATGRQQEEEMRRCRCRAYILRVQDRLLTKVTLGRDSCPSPGEGVVQGGRGSRVQPPGGRATPPPLPLPLDGATAILPCKLQRVA